MRLKGVDTAMHALASLVREGGSVHLAVAGGTADNSWTSMAANLGIEKQVQFLGSIAEMVPVFAAADVVIQATRWDACSLATIEGLAAGLPVVTTAMDGAAELIVHGKTGFVLPCPDDADALVTTMRLLLDPIVRQRIGTAARDTARHHDSCDNFRMVEKVLIEAAERRAQ
jgi:glycosyltransferase involved in cell wall biosynthesis